VTSLLGGHLGFSQYCGETGQVSQLHSQIFGNDG
jgi:hypothetical protein